MATSPEAPTIAALDIGTNSFHMVIAKAVTNGFEVITREKETVRIGHGAGEMKELDPAAIDRGIACLSRMRHLAESHGAEIRAVATSAIREARNRSDFVKRAKKEAGISIETISGIEEARLIHLGVLHGIGNHEDSMFVCDIGGGSTEVVIGNGDEMLLARSFKIGAVRLTDRFFGSATLHPSAVPSCRAFVNDLAVCSSGTAETVARIIQKKSGQPEPTSMNRFQFTGQDVAEVVKDLAQCSTVDERQEKFGIDRKRAEIILAGAIILEAIADTYGISTFMFSDYALREGVLIDTLQRQGAGPENTSGDASMRSVRLLAERCDDRPEHSENVARIAVSLFDALKSHLDVDPDDRRLLEYAALLANVGVVISHSKHHLHSYYVIRNSELVGLADRDIEIIAQVARYHRKGLPKDDHPEFARLGDADKHRVEVLAGILRVAVGLDRTQDGRVKKLKTQVTDDELVISFAPSKKLDNELNVYSAMERRSLLERVMNKRVRVTND
ncbi:MAG: hypothetical protein RIS71_1360 [Actinomycetota bacterium]